ncbi:MULTISPECIES: hypothetical protein [Frankia]|uniref:Uncharacterized protein n=1 Tax=Frankia alni (strain DSM 45986 / CECT 9034 / ACN14a) TaxID=326424 RepID=Q0RNK3_FRAAA|nr:MULTISPECIES: hypothetical protein [Frankia]CAJ60884.1 hypothetical protein FRAAL2235 [Frankia alni ACN14a]
MSPADDDDLIRRADLRDLVGIAQLQAMLGRVRGEPVSRTRAQVIAGMKGFPDPLISHPSAEDPQMRLWLRADVEGWLDTNRPGWRRDVP